MGEACPVLVWCEICRAVRRVRETPLAEMSPRRRAGLAGATLECVACGTALLTIYERNEDERCAK